MNEIEVKILEVNSEKIQSKLKALGAEKTFDGAATWTAFDFPDKRFSKEEVLIRLRKLGGKNYLTVKKLISTDGAKSSRELEVEVNDYQTASEILNTIGLKEKRGYPLAKHRISYLLNNVHFELDTFPEFPTYLEIEGPDIETIREYITKLGLSVDDAKPWGVREVFAHYRAKL